MKDDSYLQKLAASCHCTARETNALEERVRKAIFDLYSKDREDVHCTDLTLCMRRALYRKLYPAPPTMKEMGYFFDGARRHESLQKMYGEEAVVEKEIEFEGVKCTIDILENGVPIEFKTTRAANAIPEHWIRQLIFYMLALNSNKGILQIQRILPAKLGKKRSEQEVENLFPAYIIELGDKEREAWLKDFRERKSKFFESYQREDITSAPIFRGEGNWLCMDCPAKEMCDIIEGVPD